MPDEVPVKEEPAIPESSSIEALIRELESLARGVEPTLKEEVSSEAAEEPPVLAETPAESVAPTEPPATETPVSDEGIITEIAEEILAETPEEVSASLETPSGEMPAPDEVPSAASWEVPAPVAEELEKAARIMEEMEVSEYNLSAIEKAVPGFQAACVVRDGKVVARHSKRDVDWTALSQVVAAANGVFRVSLGIGEHSIDELVMGLGNLFILGFPVREAQVIVIVKSDKIGAARAYVSAALKNI